MMVVKPTTVHSQTVSLCCEYVSKNEAPAIRVFEANETLNAHHSFKGDNLTEILLNLMK